MKISLISQFQASDYHKKRSFQQDSPLEAVGLLLIW